MIDGFCTTEQHGRFCIKFSMASKGCYTVANTGVVFGQTLCSAEGKRPGAAFKAIEGQQHGRTPSFILLSYHFLQDICQWSRTFVGGWPASQFLCLCSYLHNDRQCAVRAACHKQLCMHPLNENKVKKKKASCRH